MRMKQVTFVDLVFVIPVVLAVAAWQARSQAEKSPYPSMAPLDQYLIPDRNSEIALARTGAPPSISDGAEVMVLGREGYKTAVKGTNGFLCIVERSGAQQRMSRSSGILKSARPFASIRRPQEPSHPSS